MTKPQKDPVQAEAEDETTIDVEFKGNTYTMVRSIWDLPVDYMTAVDEGRYGTAIKYLLGDTEYERFKAADSTVGDAFRLMTAHEVALGLRPGESSASSD